MYKTLALTAVAGTVSAGFNNMGAPNGMTLPIFAFTINDSNGNNMYNAMSSLNVNAGYQTLYNYQNPQQADSESYSFNIFANAILTFQHEAMTSYMGTYDFTMQLLNFTPYTQVVSWSRFDAGNGFSVNGAGMRDLEVGNFFTRVREVAKTCKWSALTNGGNMNPVCAYDQDKITDYVDPVWQFNAGAMLLNSMSMQTPWYGPNSWYMFWATYWKILYCFAFNSTKTLT